MPEDGTHVPPQMNFEAGDSRGGTMNAPGTEEVADVEEGIPGAISYGVLNNKHDEYDARYWGECDALYAGGRKLLRNKGLMENLFPQHRNESNTVYEERTRRAFYIDYPGEIIDFIVTGLMGHPIEVESDKSPDEFYERFSADSSPKGGKRQSFANLLREQILTALICRQAWTQVDFPSMDVAPETKREEEEVGAADAYAIRLDPSSVFDWEEDGTGELIWAKTCAETNDRPSVASSREMITRTYTVYTRDVWARYVARFKYDAPPEDEDMISLVDYGPHSFGRVPLVRLTLPEGLWAMNKLYSIAVEFFNKRCALSWAEFKTLFQERYEFEGPTDPLAGSPAIAEDEDRAFNQVRGVGYTQLRSSSDRVEYIGPDSTPFAHAAQSCMSLRDEMHRVTYQLALATEVGSAALNQSGDSKKENRVANAVVLAGLGEFLREHTISVYTMISDGRGEGHVWTASGGSKFDVVDTVAQIDGAEKLEGVDIPSPTFQQKYKYMIAKDVLGDEANEDDLKKIESELEKMFTMESVMAEAEQHMVEIGGDGEDDDLVGEDVGSKPAERKKPGFNSRPKPTQ